MAGWEILPPRDRVEMRLAANRVARLSDNAKKWIGMVHKGRESGERRNKTRSGSRL